MKQKQLLILSLAILVIAMATYFLAPRLVSRISEAEQTNTTRVPKIVPGQRFVFSVSLHSAKEIDKLLSRAEQLSTKIRVNRQHPSIALVLHGPELVFFKKENYKKYRQIVDRARRLDKKMVIDIKVCRTKMDELKIKKSDLPDFVDIVPYGPTEVERLVREGFVRL